MVMHIVVFILGFIVAIMVAGILAEYFKGIETVSNKFIGGLYNAGKSIAVALKDILKKKKEDKNNE